MAAYPSDLDRANIDSGSPWSRDDLTAREGEWSARRLRGNLTPANVESLLAHLRETRRAV